MSDVTAVQPRFPMVAGYKVNDNCFFCGEIYLFRLPTVFRSTSTSLTLAYDIILLHDRDDLIICAQQIAGLAMYP